MGYCPRCDDDEEGDIEWHRKCALVVLGAALLEGVPSDAYRYHPKE